jgi:hypothetical protein
VKLIAISFEVHYQKCRIQEDLSSRLYKDSQEHSVILYNPRATAKAMDRTTKSIPKFQFSFSHVFAQAQTPSTKHISVVCVGEESF